MQPKIVLLDYGVGNLKSLYWGVEKAGGKPVIARSLKDIEAFSGIVLPGQGAFKAASEAVTENREELFELIRERVPLLGICVGMHVLFEASEESSGVRGLGVFKGMVKLLPSNVKRPHIGWNSLRIVARDCPILAGIPEGGFVYFAHSYYALPDREDESIIAATTDYGISFPSVVWKENTFATQFHPERSGDLGLRILRNFVRLCGVSDAQVEP